MRQLSPAGQQTINDIAQRHGFSTNAVLSMLDSVINGNGSMAQFSHPEFSGSGQWMRGGMIMVSDMFNNHLKGRIDGLCSELSNLIANQPDIVRSGSFQSQNQGNGYSGGQQQGNGGYGTSNGFGPSSLFVPPAPGTTGDWWPADLRWPNSTGAQNGVRYACFAQARRLAIDVGGSVTVYDTLDHQPVRVGKIGVAHVVLRAAAGRVRELVGPPVARALAAAGAAAAARTARTARPAGGAVRRRPVLRIGLQPARQVVAQRRDARRQPVVEHVRHHRHAALHPLAGAGELGMVELRHGAVAAAHRFEHRLDGVGAEAVALCDVGERAGRA